MKWIGISGTWSLTSSEVEHDVRTAVRAIIERGDGIVSGGALNVDSFAADEAFKLNPSASQIKIFLPVTFDRFVTHYRKRAEEGAITKEQAETLIQQLTEIREANPESIIENHVYEVCDKESYFARNGDIVNASDELLAFCVNNSAGTMDTVEKARSQGKSVTVKTYDIA